MEGGPSVHWDAGRRRRRSQSGEGPEEVLRRRPPAGTAVQTPWSRGEPGPKQQEMKKQGIPAGA